MSLNLSPAALAAFLFLIGPAAIADETAVAERSGDRPPNIVLILADDLGWSDTTLYGTTSLYETPNVDRLAQRGMTFTRAYAASPLCSPTRAGILTGLSPARVGITAPNCHLPQVKLKASAQAVAPPGNKATQCDSATRLDTERVTLAESLKAHGYATGHFGKWHLGPEPYSPLEHGFDVDVPHWHGPGPAGSFVAPWKFPNFKANSPKEHIEDRMAEEASQFIEQHQDEPFFLNYWQFSVHAPFDAKQELIQKYRPKVDPDDPQRSPTYAAMVESFDDAIGTLLDTLDRLELANDTIVIFTSDNGGNMYNEVDGTTPTSNAPLRGGKATMYEGGVRVPWVTVWPGVTDPGATSDALVQTTDIFPTLLAMADLEPPTDVEFDGVSLVPALKGGELERDAIFTYFPHAPPVPDWLPPSASVHWRGEDGTEWKLIRLFHQGPDVVGGPHALRLYNLTGDPGETTNLHARHQIRAEQLNRKIGQFLKDSGAPVPRKNPNFDPAKYRPELIGVPARSRRAAKGN
ncbi:sulfatase [Alienimonas chondri]|uniref:Arylsulfatase n=1 Tax=Alienimonas chondri TaxID=2681879 RepID=A0ABX1VJ22_9PLAN|nr:sulfatase [Alienimonas chondri]NNJ27278.1 Arylsulfatase [Alienimonas chondri]